MGTYKWSFPSGMVNQINSGKIELMPRYSSPYETDGAFDVKVNDGATVTSYTISCSTEICTTPVTGILTIKDCGGGGDTCDLTISVKSGEPTAQAGGEVQFQHSPIPITCEITEVGEFGTGNVGAKIGTLPNDLAGCNWSFAGGGDWVTSIGVPLDKPTEIWASIASNEGEPRRTTITATCLSGEYCRGCNEMRFDVKQAGTSGGGDYGVSDDIFMYIRVKNGTQNEDINFNFHFRIKLNNNEHSYVDFYRIRGSRPNCSENITSGPGAEYDVDQLVAFDNTFTNFSSYGILYGDSNCTNGIQPIFGTNLHKVCPSDSCLSLEETNNLKTAALNMLSSCRGLDIADSGHIVYYYDTSKNEVPRNALLESVRKYDNTEGGGGAGAFYSDNKFRNGNSQADGVLYTLKIT